MTRHAPVELPPCDNAEQVTGYNRTAILLAIVAAAEAGQRAPTVRELAVRFGIVASGVQVHVGRLREAGLVTEADGRHGTLRPTARVVAHG